MLVGVKEVVLFGVNIKGVGGYQGNSSMQQILMNKKYGKIAQYEKKEKSEPL